MKKYLSIIVTIAILFSISGCTREVKPADVINEDKIVEESTPDGTACWPTKDWSTSAPEKQGLDEEMLANANERIKDNYPNIYSLLVIRHGYLVYEKYYQDMDEEDAYPVFSVTKSVMSALTGIALREKLINNVDQKVSEFLPEYFKQTDDLTKNDITIKNVLTMTGGLESIDTDYNSYFTSNDWLSYAINKPLADPPGEKFVYNTGLTHFLSGIMTETSQMSTEDFADKYLFSKIGITVDSWISDPKGYNGGGYGINMKPVDMAKFGYLYLNDGLWDGEQIIPKEWIEESTQKQIPVDAETDYGYLFWLRTVKDSVHNTEYYTYSAQGYGGQIIMVIPDLDMVAVITAKDWITSNDNSDTIDVIKDYIIPAVKP